MKITQRMLIVSTLLVSAILLRAGDSVCESCSAPVIGKLAKVDSTAPAKESTAVPARHPLKGVIVDVLGERSALLVKHEEIPGVMKAMTMLLKVDAATLASAEKGAAITGELVRKADGWWLENVKPVAATASPASS